MLDELRKRDRAELNSAIVQRLTATGGLLRNHPFTRGVCRSSVNRDTQTDVSR